MRELNKASYDGFTLNELLFLSWLNEKSIENEKYPDYFIENLNPDQIIQLFLDLDYLDIVDDETSIDYLTLTELNEIFQENMLHSFNNKRDAVLFFKKEFSSFYIQNIIGKGFYYLTENGKQLLEKYEKKIPYDLLKKDTLENKNDREFIFKTRINLLGLSKFLVFIFSLISFLFIEKYLRPLGLNIKEIKIGLSLCLGIGIAYIFSYITYPKYIGVSKRNFIVEYRLKNYTYEIEQHEFTLEDEWSKKPINYMKRLVIYRKGTYMNEFILGKYLTPIQVDILVNDSILSTKLKKRL